MTRASAKPSKMHRLNVLFGIFLILTFNTFTVESILSVSACKDITGQSVELRLKNHLFCDYDTDVRPVNRTSTNKTEVGIYFMPKLLDFEELTGTLTVHAWVAMNWSDPHLTWNPNDFEGTSSLHISSIDIWIPDITVFNSGDFDEDQTGFPTTECGLINDGSIMCVPMMKMVAHCDGNYANYPYDVQNCTINLTSRAYQSEEVSLFLAHKIYKQDFHASTDWEVLQAYATTKLQDFMLNTNQSSQVCTLNFVIQRRISAMHIFYVSPSIVLMVMTLTVLWLDSQSSERMIVAAITFICHLIFIQELHQSVPYNGGIMPSLLQFYESSFFLTAFALIFTVLLRELQCLSTSAPGWITAATSAVLQSRAGQLLLLSILDPKASLFLEEAAEDNADLVRPGKKHATWHYVALLLGWLAFIVVFLVYLVMLAIYLPTRAAARV